MGGDGFSNAVGASKVEYEIRRVERDREGTEHVEVIYYDGDYKAPSRVPSK